MQLEKSYKKRAEFLANRTEMHEVRAIIADRQEKQETANSDRWKRAKEELVEKRKQKIEA
jgi:hypothetical protein